MISHVDTILQTCKATDLHDQVVKIFNIGSCFLRCLEKPSANELLRQVELTLSQLKFRTDPEDIQKEHRSLITHYVDNGNGAMLSQSMMAILKLRRG